MGSSGSSGSSYTSGGFTSTDIALWLKDQQNLLIGSTIQDYIKFKDDRLKLSKTEDVNANNVLKIYNKATDDSYEAYVEIGARNTEHMHFFTDRNKYHFNKQILVTDKISLYDNTKYIVNEIGTVLANNNVLSIKNFADGGAYIATLEVGARNVDYMHFHTDRSKFYFNKTSWFDTKIGVYDSVLGEATNTYLTKDEGRIENYKILTTKLATSKGDIYAFKDALRNYDRLGVGVDKEILTADSTATLGLKWSSLESLLSAELPLIIEGTPKKLKLKYSATNLKVNGSNQIDTIQDITTTSDIQFSKLGLGGVVDTNYRLKIHGSAKITNDLYIDGNLYINGEINQLNVTELQVDDNVIMLNNGGTDMSGAGGGIKVMGDSGSVYSYITYSGSNWDIGDSVNLPSGDEYKINYVSVLNSTTLGSTIVNSSLTGVGTLVTGIWNATPIKAQYIYFNTGNLKDDGSPNFKLNTIQDINTGATPTFANMNLGTGGSYKINNVSILSSTVLGSSVTDSSLTKVGTLITGIWNATKIDGTYINYNITNLKVVTSQLNTIQDITTSSTPTFTQVIIGSQASSTNHVVRADRTLSITSDTNVTVTNSAISLDLTNNRSWTLGWAGQLSLTRGGTGTDLTSGAQGGVVYRGASSLGVTSQGIVNQLLVSQGSGAPSWLSLSNTYIPFGASNGSVATSSNFTWTDSSKTLTLGGNVYIQGDSSTLTLRPSGNIIVAPQSGSARSMSPENSFDVSLGTINKKWWAIHSAELWVETLVAQETIATIGGRILVGNTTELTQDLSSGSTTIFTKHNNLNSGDIVYMQGLDSNGNFRTEFMRIGSSAYVTTGGYYYINTTRGFDGSGADSWDRGGAIFNTGTTGSGFIDIYSIDSLRRKSGDTSVAQYGPTIVGNVRYSNANKYAYSEYWAIGQLNGLYGQSSSYGVAFGKYVSGTGTYVVINDTSGIRFFNDGNTIAQWDMSGNLILGYAYTENLYLSYNYLALRYGSTEYVRLDNTAVTVGLSTSYNTYITSSGVDIREGGTVWARYASNITLGLSTSDRIVIDSSSIKLYEDSSNVIMQVTGANIYVGRTTSNYVHIDSSSVKIKNSSGETLANYSSYIVLGKIQNSNMYTYIGGATIQMVWVDAGGGSNVLADWTSGAITLGKSTLEHLVIDSSSIKFYSDSTTIRGSLDGTNWVLGSTTEKYVSINDTSVSFIDYNGGSPRTRAIFGATVTIGNTLTNNVYITDTYLSLRYGSSTGIYLATDGSGYIAQNNISWTSAGVVSIGQFEHTSGKVSSMNLDSVNMWIGNATKNYANNFIIGNYLSNNGSTWNSGFMIGYMGNGVNPLFRIATSNAVIQAYSDGTHPYIGVQRSGVWRVRMGSLYAFDNTLSTDTYGFAVVNSAGEYVFRSDSTGVDRLSGWNINKDYLADENLRVVINATNTSIYARPLGSSFSTKYVMLGQTHDGNNWTGYYGISAVNGYNQYLFRIDDGGDNQISGWSINYNSLTGKYGTNPYYYVGMAKPSSSTTKCFFAGATDTVGTNSKFSVLASGKIVINDISGNVIFDSEQIYIDLKNMGRIFYSDNTLYTVSLTFYTEIKSGTLFLLPQETTVQAIFRAWISSTTPTDEYGKVRLKLEQVNQLYL